MPSTRHDTVVEARRHQVVELYLQQKYQSEIAALVGVTQQQVSLDIQAIRKAWRASDLRDFDAAKDAELAKVDLLEREAWAAWDRSKQPREVTVTEAVEGKGGVIVTRKATRRLEGQAGDPRFLEQVQKCITKRCEILGLNAPQKAALTSPDGTQPWDGTVLYLPSKAPTPEEWQQAVAHLQTPPLAEA